MEHRNLENCGVEHMQISRIVVDDLVLSRGSCHLSSQQRAEVQINDASLSKLSVEHSSRDKQDADSFVNI
jgi:hypothetical protein